MLCLFAKNIRKISLLLLTALFEICYYNSMEQNTLELNERIARNLALYRKRAGMTQAELAERINYSDKSVSKWESGNGVPDIYILVQLAEIFGVTVNDLVAEEPPKGAPRRENVGLHTMIMALSSGIVWLVATCVFVILNMIPYVEGALWMTFIFAAVANSIVLIVFSGVWKYKWLNFVSVSLTVWTVLLSIFCTLKYIVGYDTMIWLIFLLGAPLQVLEILWTFFRFSIFKRKRAEKTKE